MVEASDIALLLVFFGSYNSKVRGRTRVQKDICILKHEDKIPFNFKFEPYYYGPYSSELTDLIDTFVAAGLLEQTIVYLDLGIYRYDYTLTEEGKRMFQNTKKVFEDKTPGLITKLEERVKALKEMTIPDVVILAKKCSGIQSTG